MSRPTLTAEGLESALSTFMKLNFTKNKNINDWFNDNLIINDVINFERLKEIAEDPVYKIAYLLIRNNTEASISRKGETVPSIYNNLISHFIKHPFNKYLIPLLVLTSGNMINHFNYWSLKIKLKINLEKIAEITKTEIYNKFHKL